MLLRAPLSSVAPGKRSVRQGKAAARVAYLIISMLTKYGIFMQMGLSTETVPVVHPGVLEVGSSERRAHESFKTIKKINKTTTTLSTFRCINRMLLIIDALIIGWQRLSRIHYEP